MPRQSEYFAAVTQALDDAPGPLSAREIHDALAQTGIGIATVYRLVKRGVEAGQYTPVNVPNGPTHYQPSDRPRHHHFECVTCNRLFDLAGSPGTFDDLTPDGFTLESHELFLRGQCSQCAAEAES